MNALADTPPPPPAQERRRTLEADASLSADALERFRAILQLPDLSLLEGNVLLRQLAPGQVIMTEGAYEVSWNEAAGSTVAYRRGGAS